MVPPVTVPGMVRGMLPPRVAVRVPLAVKVKVPLGSMVTGPDRVKVVVGNPIMVPASCMVPEKVPPG